MKTAMQLIRKNETPVLRCDCGEIFCINSKDSIHTMGLKDVTFRKKHEKCVQNKKYPELRTMPNSHNKNKER